jgi:FHA domain
MATVRCEYGHVYDDKKHTGGCPWCPNRGLKDVNIPETLAARNIRPGLTPTEPVSPQDGRAPVRGGDSGGMAGPTIGFVQKRKGFDPCVGWIICIKGANKGRDYRLHSDRNTLGRARNMDVCIEADETISREDHCHIAYGTRNKTFNVVPGTGRNLVYLNNKEVLSAMPLAPYDRLDLGESSFLFIPFCTDRFDWEREAVKDPEPDKRDRRSGGPTVLD